MSKSTKDKISYAIIRWRSLVENVILPAKMDKVKPEVKERFCKEILKYQWSSVDSLHGFLSVPTYRPLLMEVIKKRRTVQDVIDMPDAVKDDIAFMKEAMNYNSKILGVASNRIRLDYDVAVWSANATPAVLHKMLRYSDDEKLLIPIFDREPTYISNYTGQRRVLSSKNIVSAAIKASSSNIVYAEGKLKEDPELILLALDGLKDDETLRGRVSRISITNKINSEIVLKGVQKDLVWLLQSESIKLNEKFCDNLVQAVIQVTPQTIISSLQKIKKTAKDSFFQLSPMKDQLDILCSKLELKDIQQVLSTFDTDKWPNAHTSFEEIRFKKELVAIPQKTIKNERKARKLLL